MNNKYYKYYFKKKKYIFLYLYNREYLAISLKNSKKKNAFLQANYGLAFFLLPRITKQHYNFFNFYSNFFYTYFFYFLSPQIFLNKQLGLPLLTFDSSLLSVYSNNAHTVATLPSNMLGEVCNYDYLIAFNKKIFNLVLKKKFELLLGYNIILFFKLKLFFIFFFNLKS